LNATSDKWTAGDAYEAFMGRWSRLVAESFLDWLAPTPLSNWLELGCGTGALTGVICMCCRPGSIVACDPSPEFVSLARNSIQDCPATLMVAAADNLPRREGGFDFVASGLVLNFLPDPADAVHLMMDRVRPGGTLAAYVWDYAEGTQFLRIFWDEAIALDPSAAAFDEGRRFPLCQLDALSGLFRGTGLEAVETTALEIPTSFPDFDAYWSPFLGGTGPAPSYVDSLDPDRRTRLGLQLKQRLARSGRGPIRLTARALGVRGTVAN
jgi:SAM-dependent methyltransferase